MVDLEDLPEMGHSGWFLLFNLIEAVICISIKCSFKVFQMRNENRDHSFSPFANFFEKLTFLTSHTQTY